MVQGNDIDEKTDCWSLGVLLFEIFAGHHKFAGVTKEQISEEIVTNSIDPPNEVKEKI